MKKKKVDFGWVWPLTYSLIFYGLIFLLLISFSKDNDTVLAVLDNAINAETTFVLSLPALILAIIHLEKGDKKAIGRYLMEILKFIFLISLIYVAGVFADIASTFEINLLPEKRVISSLFQALKIMIFSQSVLIYFGILKKSYTIIRQEFFQSPGGTE